MNGSKRVGGAGHPGNHSSDIFFSVISSLFRSTKRSIKSSREWSAYDGRRYCPYLSVGRPTGDDVLDDGAHVRGDFV